MPESPTPRIRTAEIVAVGTELLLGEITDTNGAWLAASLADRGVDVHRAVRVRDDLDRVVEALRTACDAADLVLISGGLGPTEDDLTREAIAALVGETPRIDPTLEAELRARYARSGRPMPERNLKQAWTIPSAATLTNPHGTAPGWLVRWDRPDGPRWLAALPGPPHELKPMLEERLLPVLPLPNDRLWVTVFKTAGLGESELADRLGELANVMNPNVATYAKADGVHVRVAAKASDGPAAEALGRPLAREVAA
ncbi:MAG: molybdopterin-binding protein, partial [Trueperaceae bacterium]